MYDSRQIERRLQEVRDGRKDLDLSSNAIGRYEQIPAEIFSFSHLEALNLRGQNIRVVPEFLRDLPSLKRLDLSQNPVQRVPDIPGLILDWNSYIRCRAELSREN